MAISEFKTLLEKDTLDIQQLAQLLVDLTTNVRNLVETQKDLKDLSRSQVEHNMEIQSLKNSLRDLCAISDKINERIGALEDYQLTVTAASNARSSLVDTIVKYGPVIVTVFLTFILVGAVLTLKELKL